MCERGTHIDREVAGGTIVEWQNVHAGRHPSRQGEQTDGLDKSRKSTCVCMTLCIKIRVRKPRCLSSSSRTGNLHICVSYSGGWYQMLCLVAVHLKGFSKGIVLFPLILVRPFVDVCLIGFASAAYINVQRCCKRTVSAGSGVETCRECSTLSKSKIARGSVSLDKAESELLP